MLLWLFQYANIISNVFFLFFSETFRPLLLLSQVNETNETFRKTKRIKETYKMFHKKQKEKKKRQKKKIIPSWYI